MEIKKKIDINASTSDVYNALTTPERIVKYFPLNEVRAEWKEGGEILFIGDESGIDRGKIDRLEEGSIFGFTYWNANHGTEDKPEHRVRVCYRLEEMENGTSLLLIQENLPSAEYQEIMEPVWDVLLANLKSHLEEK